MRNPLTRFLPWFDTYQGDIFRQFLFQGVQHRGDATVLSTQAVSDPDTPFRERRDVSGDPCFRTVSWDATPLTAKLDICFEPVRETIDGRDFTGFKYWFEFDGPVAIHRLLDRQTWEVGGNLNDVTLTLRNWLTAPRFRVTRENSYSTVGLDQWTALLPGNLWGRWTLLPSFDMQNGNSGTLLGWFDEVSLIRTVIQTAPGEDALRCQDMHYFAQSQRVRTNPKTIVWSGDVLSEVETLNLWTRMQDRENQRAREQFGMPEEGPPAIVFSHNQWRGFHLDHSYNNTVDVAAEFGGDYVFIDAIWENGQAYKETLDALIPAEKRAGSTLDKIAPTNMCVTLDFEVAEIFGGERGLRDLCKRARDKGVGIISWMAMHYHPHTTLQNDPALRRGTMGVFAAKESGYHPDTGYASACWTANMNAPIFDKLRSQFLGVCERTGMAGYLWDSYCNLGWWQVDYSNGDMRPQFDKMAQLYADMVKAGLYIQPEAIVTFSRHSCCGLHGGNVYAGELLGYSYNTNISLSWGHSVAGSEVPKAVDWPAEVLQGKQPVSMLFECFAHARIPNVSFHDVPRDQWHAQSVAAIKELFAVYRKHRHLMQRRTVLPDGLGVLWEHSSGQGLLFVFADHVYQGPPPYDAVTQLPAADGRVQAQHVYLVTHPKPPAAMST